MVLQKNPCTSPFTFVKIMVHLPWDGSLGGLSVRLAIFTKKAENPSWKSRPVGIP